MYGILYLLDKRQGGILVAIWAIGVIVILFFVVLFVIAKSNG